MIKTLLTSILFVFATSAHAQSSLPIEQCNAQVPYGNPFGGKLDVTLICRQGYILEHDNKAKIPEWVSYVLTPEHAVGCFPRSNAFAPDPLLQRGSRAELKDYAKTGYDIGHQANDGDMAWSEVTEKESFLLSNMAPQLPGFNRGIWKKLEDYTRALAVVREHPLLIHVGPVYSANDKTIGADGVVVPHAFYKIIVDTVTKEAMVFYFEHKAVQGSLNLFIVPLARITKETSVAFFMPKDVKFSTQIWPSTTKSVRAAKRKVCAK